MTAITSQAPAERPLLTTRAVLLALGLLVLAVVPLVGNDYWLNSLIIPTVVMGLAGVGLNLLTGYAGLVSLGSAAFMSIGAFSTYNLLLRVPGLPLPAR